MLSPSRQTTAPSRHRTANMSTTTRRYLYSCPAPRPSTPVRTHSHFRRGVPSQGPCPDGSKTRSPSSRSKTWRCAFRPREVSGGRECCLSTNQLVIRWKKYVQMSWFIFQFGTRKGCFCIMCHVYAATRSRRNMQISNIGFWESWRRSQSNSRRKVWAQIRGGLTNLLPWQRTLHSIKGITLTVLFPLNWMLHRMYDLTPNFVLQAGLESVWRPTLCFSDIWFTWTSFTALWFAVSSLCPLWFMATITVSHSEQQTNYPQAKSR